MTSIGPCGKACRRASRLCRCRLTEIGAFPGKSRPRVIWVGLGGDVDGLSRIKVRLDALLEPLGFTPENRRPFKPHLTIGRVKKINNPRQLNMAFGHRLRLQTESRLW